MFRTLFSNKFNSIKMASNFTEVISTCKHFMSTKLGMTNINDPLLNAVAEGLGSAIYHPDASLVACSDKEETGRVKTDFLIGTLKLANSKLLDDAITKVCKKMGASNRKKYRVVFYYLLLEHFGLENHFLPAVASAVVAAPVEQDISAIDAAFEAQEVIKTALVSEAVSFPVTHVEVQKEEEHDHLLHTITQTLGSHAESSPVNMHDHEERHRIREHFLRGRLGLRHHDHAVLDAAIHAVHEKMGPEAEKNRAAFYYHLTKHFGAEHAITNSVPSNLF